MMLSQSCAYGLRAAIYLVMLDRSGYVSIRELSDELNLSFHFLTKVLQRLTRDGLLTSQRGPQGGVRLARPADQIRLKDLLIALDGPALFTQCVLGLPGCGERKPCPLHDRWSEERRRLDALFRDTTLAELALATREHGYRLQAPPKAEEEPAA